MGSELAQGNLSTAAATAPAFKITLFIVSEHTVGNRFGVGAE
jgi:hypothetical protein